MVSIREKNHRYIVVYYVTDDAGERKQRWEIYKTRAEACKRKRELLAEQDKALLAGSMAEE